MYRSLGEKKWDWGGREAAGDGAQLAAWWSYSNLVILVTLKKGNHPGEAYERRGRRKDLYRRERPCEEAEIQR